MRQGAPGVNCSPRMKPSLSQRWTVEVAVPRTAAACRTVSNSPSGMVGGGLKRGMFHCRRKLPTWLAVKRLLKMGEWAILTPQPPGFREMSAKLVARFDNKPPNRRYAYGDDRGHRRTHCVVEGAN